MTISRVKRITAEAVGTALLLAAAVGSGIMGERLTGGNVAITLLANTLATGAMLVAFILTCAPSQGRISMAAQHFFSAGLLPLYRKLLILL